MRSCSVTPSSEKLTIGISSVVRLATWMRRARPYAPVVSVSGSMTSTVSPSGVMAKRSVKRNRTREASMVSSGTAMSESGRR